MSQGNPFIGNDDDEMNDPVKRAAKIAQSVRLPANYRQSAQKLTPSPLTVTPPRIPVPPMPRDHQLAQRQHLKPRAVLLEPEPATLEQRLGTEPPTRKARTPRKRATPHGSDLDAHTPDTLTIRGVPPEIVRRLRSLAHEYESSFNSQCLRALKKGVALLDQLGTE